MLNPTFQQKIAGKITSRTDGLHSNPWLWALRGSLSCPGHVLPSSVHSPVSRGCFSLSSLTANPPIFCLCQPPSTRVCPPFLPSTHNLRWAVQAATHSQSLLTNQGSCSNNIALSLLHHQPSFFHSAGSSSTVYNNAVTSPSWKNKQKHPSLANIEKRLVDTAGKERMGPTETVALKHIHYHV